MKVKDRRVIIAVVIVLVAAIATFAKLPGLRTSLPGSVVRFCLGESGSAQWVNNTADTIVDSGWTKELEDLSDQLSKGSEVGSKPTVSSDRLPPRLRGLPTISPDRFPPKLRRLGSYPYNDDEANLLLRPEKNGPPTILIIWGHGREEILIFGKPPAVSPEGLVRKVDSRIYVVANES